MLQELKARYFFHKFIKQHQPFFKTQCLNLLNLKDIFMNKMALKFSAFVLYLSGKAFPSILQHLKLLIAPELFYVPNRSYAASSHFFQRHLKSGNNNGTFYHPSPAMLKALRVIPE